MTRPGAAFWAIVVALVAILVLLGWAAAQAWAGPSTWPQVTRCEVLQPEDLDSTR